MLAALKLRYPDAVGPSSPTSVPAGTSSFMSSNLWLNLSPEYLRDLTAGRHPFSEFEDSLTGLANRSAAQALIDGSIRRGRSFGLVLIDLDGFKEVNDSLGHDAGDHLLQRVAESLTSANDGRLVARLGGDEFLLILPEVKSDKWLMKLASAACDGLKHGVADDFIGAVHASAGAVRYPAHATNWQGLLKRADIALYEAKRAGRDRAKVFGTSMQARVERRARGIAQAHQCLQETHRLKTFFQPKKHIVSGKITGFEALLRCTDNDGVPRAPTWLSEALEDSSVAVAVGRNVLEHTLQFLKTTDGNRNACFKVAINATAHELRQPGWASAFIDRLCCADVRPSAIEIEVHESVLLDGLNGSTMRAIKMLHDAGVRISLDDFGTGYASLAHLRSCPVDALKIDRSFIRNLLEPEAQAIVRAIIDLARALSLGVVAEGVEKRWQHELLRLWGCPEAQGYYYGRPACPERWLHREQ